MEGKKPETLEIPGLRLFSCSFISDIPVIEPPKYPRRGCRGFSRFLD